MRFDKFTTRFQQAFADAQSAAVGSDHAYIEPQHLLQALLNQEDGGTASLLARTEIRKPKFCLLERVRDIGKIKKDFLSSEMPEHF